jgi:hypothetical protein
VKVCEINKGGFVRKLRNWREIEGKLKEDWKGSFVKNCVGGDDYCIGSLDATIYTPIGCGF